MTSTHWSSLFTWIFHVKIILFTHTSIVRRKCLSRRIFKHFEGWLWRGGRRTLAKYIFSNKVNNRFPMFWTVMSYWSRHDDNGTKSYAFELNFKYWDKDFQDDEVSTEGTVLAFNRNKMVKSVTSNSGTCEKKYKSPHRSKSIE